MANLFNMSIKYFRSIDHWIPPDSRLLRQNTQSVLEGVRLSDGPIEKSLITQFELLNLVPLGVKSSRQQQQQQRMKSAFSQHPARRDYQAAAAASGSLGGSPGGIPMTGNGGNKYGLTKWRRVGLITGSNVHLDTIVWPGGDIVVSGLSARPRSVFRVVTALAPPFVMESDLDEDGLCLRGLPCHRLLPTGEEKPFHHFCARICRGGLGRFVFYARC